VSGAPLAVPVPLTVMVWEPGCGHVLCLYGDAAEAKHCDGCQRGERDNEGAFHDSLSLSGDPYRLTNRIS
jgi:hypothetical protein